MGRLRGERARGTLGLHQEDSRQGWKWVGRRRGFCRQAAAGLRRESGETEMKSLFLF